MMEIMQFIITSLVTPNQGYEDTTNDSKFVFLHIKTRYVSDQLHRAKPRSKTVQTLTQKFVFIKLS